MRAVDASLRQFRHMRRDLLRPDLREQFEASHHRVDVRNRRRPALKAPRGGRRLVKLRIEGEGIGLRKPPALGRRQLRNDLFTHIEERKARRPQ